MLPIATSKEYPSRLPGNTMLTLEQLQEFYGYPILTDEEVALVHSRSLNWSSLEGEIILRKCVKSFPAYLQAANFGYKITAYHYSLAANQQRDFETGPNMLNGKRAERPYSVDPHGKNDYGIILLSAPPQTGKSLSISESFPSWVSINNPRIRIICIGYSSNFAARFGRRNRDKVISLGPVLTRGKMKVHDKIQSSDNWEMMLLDTINNYYYSSNGGMVTTGMDGQTTGNTGNYIQVDDPIKNMQEATSELLVIRNIELFQSAIETRLRANPGAMLCVMNTRWVTNDLHGWLRRHRKKYIVGDYNYAALCTEENQHNDPLLRIPGEGICPEMSLGAQWAENVKESYEAGQGAHVFRALYQGDPSDEKGNLFRDENWGEYEIDKVWKDFHRFDRIYLSIDATFKDLTTSDFVGMELTGIKGGNTYLRYLVRKQMDLPDTIDKIIKIVGMFPEIDVIYIEDKANGPGIIQVMKKWRKKLGISERDWPSVVAIQPEGGKYSRAQTAATYQREGRCYIPCEKDAHRLSSEDDFVWEEGGVSYTHCYKHELGTFPFAGNDDLVDSFSQGIKKNIGLLDGEEKPETRVQRFTRYSNWWPEMWDDYKSLKDRATKDAFIRMHGAPKEWKPKEEGGTL